VVACANAEAALAHLDAGHEVDVLFSDIMLGPGIDGHELARRLSARPQPPAVLLTSGYSHHLAQTLGATSGAAGETPALRWPVLSKPYTREALAQALSSVTAAASSHHRHRRSTPG
jgi:CheY-like chemotaxis protein